MSWNDVREAFKQKELTPGEKYLLISLADCRNNGTKLCFPGSAFLAEKTNYSARQVKRLIKSLHEKEIISITKKKTSGRFPSNHYSFVWDDELEDE